MNTSKLQIFYAPLRARINQMTDELSIVIQEANLSGVVASEVMVSEQHVSWAVQYRPHNDPGEEYIGVEAVIFVKVEEKEGKLSCELTWSHGEVITPYIEDEVRSYRSLDELVVYVCQQWDRLKATFLEDMKREMQIERPPVYRVF